MHGSGRTFSSKESLQRFSLKPLKAKPWTPPEDNEKSLKPRGSKFHCPNVKKPARSR